MKTLGLILLVTSWLTVSASAVEVGLTVEERLGVARSNEPVTSGVPLPKGALKDAAGLRLFGPDGKPVPVQFGVANRWWDDGSIKWLHVDFQASVPARSQVAYVLRAADAPMPPPPAALTVTPAGDGFAVNTGPLHFTVKGKGFNLFDTLRLNNTPLLKAGHKGGFRIRTGEGEFSPGACPDGKIVIEEQGPMKVVLLATGRHVAADGSGYALDYKCRIYAYAGSPRVKVVYTVENRRGEWTDHIAVADWRLELPLTLGNSPRFLLGLAEGRPMAGALTGSPRIEVLATDLYRVSGAGPSDREGDPKKEDPAEIGTLDVRGSQGGVTVGMRHFWQTWAKTLGADKDGTLTLGFWTDRVRDKGETCLVDENGHAQFFAGMAWTHEFRLNIHDGKGAEPLAVMASAREPLFARCPPEWYCMGTRVFGNLSEANPEVYLPDWRERVEALNRWAEQSVKRPLARWHSVKSGKVDSFGMFSFGDGVEEVKGTEPRNVHWEGGYYDYPHSVFLNFARTGDLFYLWLGHDMSRHNADVHHTHHDKVPGRSRYCPSREHILMSRSGKLVPFASPTFNHWKNLSAFERWYLTGDHRGREAAIEISQWALRLGNSGIDFSQPRSIIHGILGLWAAYDATGEQRYADALKSFAQRTAQRLASGRRMGSGPWMRGMAIHGLCWYVEQTGDESVMPGIEAAIERDLEARSDELAYGMVFMWNRTGDPKYFHAAARYIRGGRAEKWMQRFGNRGRSRLYTPTLVRKDAPRPAPVKEE